LCAQEKILYFSTIPGLEIKGSIRSKLVEQGSLPTGFVVVAKLCHQEKSLFPYILIKQLMHCTLKVVDIGIVAIISFAS
jgi:hypothetical protein